MREQKARELVLVGCDHRIVPPSTIGTAFDHVIPALVDARRDGVIAGGLWMQTCNRVELLLDVRDARAGREFARDVLGGGVPWRDDAGPDAVRRMLRIATGLDSMVLGEVQIVGQLTRAFQVAEDAGLLSRALHMLRTRLLATARHLRADVPCAGPLSSVAALGVDLAVEAGERVGVLGAGETARLVLEILQRRGVGMPVVVNRTLRHAESLARRFAGHAVGIEEFDAKPPELDALICAVNAPGILVTPRHAEHIGRVVDLSRPSVCAPDIVRGGQVVDLDALADVAARHGERQREAAEVLGARVDARVDRIWDQIRLDRAYLGKVVDLHVESASAEIEAALRGRLKHLEHDDREVLRSLTRRLAKRHAHYHILDLEPPGAR